MRALSHAPVFSYSLPCMYNYVLWFMQVCAHCLNIPIDKIHISETSTDKIPNSSDTAASLSTDLYGMAVKDCCDQIMERLKPIREEDPNSTWEQLVSVCNSIPVIHSEIIAVH